jgi:S1-C subfamily serine protease
MQSLRSRIGLFLGGVGTALLILPILVIAGVLPVKSEKTTVIVRQTANTSTTALRSAALTAQQIYQRDARGVVEIEATFTSDSSQGAFPFPFSIGPQTEQALGSGFVVSREGYILTNAHVVSSNGQTVKTVRVVFKGLGSQTKQVSGTVVGADNTSDVALIKVDPSKLGPLDVIPLGNSAGVQPGEPVVAIGNPLGYDFSITAGIVSATNRDLQSPNGATISNGIQTDAAINEGNSGGPLIDSSGHVIGINEQIATQSGGNEGLGFAVPIDSAVGVMGQLKKSGSVTYAWLGISGETLTADVAQALGIKTTQGVLVTQVRAGTPAAKAGLKGGTAQLSLQGQTYQVGGDIITAINNTKLSGMEQLTTIIAAHKPGDVVSLTIVRDSQTKSIKVTLAARPASA